MTPNTPTPSATAPAGHTATPWVKAGLEVFKSHESPYFIADCFMPSGTHEESAANAAHIVHCVNTHSQLLAQNAALREALSSIERYGLDTMSGPADEVADMAQWIRDGVREMVHRARAALKLVTP